MKSIRIATTKPYDVLIGEGLLARAGELLTPLFSGCKVCILTDSHVGARYIHPLKESLTEAGFTVSDIIFPAGEHAKNIDTYGNVMNALADEELGKSDVILTLGGGVVCDMAGFVAGTYMRGIAHCILPTTLPAAIDAAIGGKASLDLSAGKDLAGLFCQPALVLTDTEILSSLPPALLTEGSAEVIKCGAVADKELITAFQESNYPYVLERCVSIKKSLVEADVEDKSIRQLLDFGHTIGHAIEKWSAYTLSHGQAVAKGMVAEARGAFRTGLSATDISGELENILQDCGYDTTLPTDVDAIYALCRYDQKIRKGRINVVVPEYLGKCNLHKLDMPAFRELIEKALLK